MTAGFAEYWAAVACGDAGSAVRVAERELEGGSLADVLDDLVCAAQAAVGRLWAANEWNVAQEHQATAVGEEVVAALSARIAAEPNGRTAVIACVDGEWHSLPARVLSAMLRDAGWGVSFLGASVPAGHMSQLLHDRGPDITAVSCALPTRLFAARRMIETSRSAGIPVLVGGRGFGADGRWGRAVGADAWAPDARTAIGLLAGDALTGFTTSAPPVASPDDAIAHLRGRSAAIVADGLVALAGSMPEVTEYTAYQLERTEEDLRHILDFLCAALYVDDVTLFTEFIAWLADLLAARGVPPGTLRAGLRLVATAIDAQVGPYGRALSYLAAGADTVLGRTGSRPGRTRKGADMAGTVRDNGRRSRYEILIDGAVAGFLQYRLEGEVVDFLHTETLPGHEGEGLGSQLVREALADTRAHGRLVRPSCPFVRGYLERHPQLRDVVPAAERKRFGLDG